MSNTEIWDQVWQTDTSQTKRYKMNGGEYTAINPTYMIYQATKIWGPVGIDWGYEIIEERYDQGAPIIHNDTETPSVMHTLRLKLWYTHNGKRGEIEHFGHTPYVQRTKFGPQTDFDAPKKSLTDAFKKCLSMLGFSADIFMGLFDLPEYVEERRVEESIQQADDQDDAALKARTEFNEFLAEQMRGYGLTPSKAALTVFHRSIVNKARRRAETLRINPDQVEQRLTEEYNKHLERLAPAKEQEVVCESCGTVSNGIAGSECRECGKKTTPASTGANDHQQ
ncbi:MAG: hypothetical protein ACQES7_04230 [Pseudomonadota bacterium]